MNFFFSEGKKLNSVEFQFTLWFWFNVSILQSVHFFAQKSDFFFAQMSFDHGNGFVTHTVDACLCRFVPSEL